MLNVIDDCTRECLCIEVSTGFSGRHVTRVLERLCQERGRPEVIRSDNGPEYISAVTLAWGTELGKTYRVQFTSSLNADAWTDLAGDMSGTGGAVVKVDTTFDTAPQRFYRVVELP